MRVEKEELKKIFMELLALKSRYQRSASWRVIWNNLINFCESRGVKISEAKYLTVRRRAWGSYCPLLSKIYIQRRNIKDMVEVLAHEVGHVIAFKAGILKKYAFDEDIADELGYTIMDILSR